jgi:hypothetical protein
MDIQPDKQNLDQTFSTTVYYIDFYQRDYKWTEEPVRRLLDDVFYQFEESYLKHGALEPNKENINARYPWYYLNTYVTNTVGGKVFVVDGQQRLTTLTLILIKLHQMAKAFDSKTVGWLERKIAGYSGTEHEFWMNHVRHIQVLHGLMEGLTPRSIDTRSGVTAVNMVKNFEVISAELESRLTERHRFDTFVHYFLFRLVLINLSVDLTHVPMVFEVINDRGVRLKPYEILKGKLLGQIDKVELDHGDFNERWESQLKAVNAFREDEIDNFFRYWLKAKYAENRKSGQRFDGDYHREMFKADINELLKLEHNPSQVKSFLTGAFRYYTTLYARLWKATKSEDKRFPSVFYNSLNELDSQFMLVLSACSVDDPSEDEKIQAVSDQLDRLFTLLQLQGAYSSNLFATRLFDISKEIREQPVDIIHTVFEKHLILELKERRAMDIKQGFSYPLFRPMSIDRLNTRFTRYFFGRIERFISDGMKLGMKRNLYDLVTARGAKTGFHIEHILSRNSENQALFNHDEDRFEQERNRLGGVLLLKGKDNISSNNEVYAKKLKTYANTLYWNETLRADAYQSKLDFRDFARKHNLNFRPLEQFGPNELEERQRLLFDIASITWAPKN